MLYSAMQSPHEETESSPPYTSTLISQIPAMTYSPPPNNLDYSRVLVNHPLMYRTSPTSFPPEGGIDFCDSSAGFFQFDAGLFSGTVFSGNDRQLLLHGLPSEVSGVMPDFLERKRLLQAVSSKSHSEAEKRRRERINAHLATLRSLLPNTTKTDKASLLKEVIQHVKDLKRRTSELSSELSFLLPSESNEVNVQAGGVLSDGKMVMKASFSCEDQSDVLPELMNAVKMLRLKMVKAEMATLGGRMRNVLFVVPEEKEDQSHNSGVGCLKEALIGVMERSLGREAWGGKRQRLNRNIGSW